MKTEKQYKECSPRLATHYIIKEPGDSACYPVREIASKAEPILSCEGCIYDGVDDSLCHNCGPDYKLRDTTPKAVTDGDSCGAFYDWIDHMEFPETSKPAALKGWNACQRWMREQQGEGCCPLHYIYKGQAYPRLISSEVGYEVFETVLPAFGGDYFIARIDSLGKYELLEIAGNKEVECHCEWMRASNPPKGSTDKQ